MKSFVKYWPFANHNPGDIVTMSDGTKYEVGANGWRKTRGNNRKVARETRKLAEAFLV
jgi:hypothetical protein